MRISTKLIEGVVSEVAGEDVVPLVRFLKNKKNISEFKIASALRAEVNATRNMLYRLYDNNLVSFIRKKDKKKGWYIYYWTFNPKTVGYLKFNLRQKRLESLKERLKREQGGNFFICEDKCMRLDFEQATNFEFKCVECSKLLEQDDNREVIENIEEEINDIEQGLIEKDIKPEPIKVVKKVVSKKKPKKVVKKKVVKKRKKK